MLEPYGLGNSEPVLLASDLKVLNSCTFGFNHLKLKVQGNDSKVWDAIGFKMGDISPSDGEKINLVFTPQVNNWKGNKNIQLKIKDFKIA